jgi:hypothetical protein
LCGYSEENRSVTYVRGREIGEERDIGLVLKKSTRVQNLYERIGVVGVPMRISWNWFEDGEMKAVSIV